MIQFWRVYNGFEMLGYLEAVRRELDSDSTRVCLLPPRRCDSSENPRRSAHGLPSLMLRSLPWCGRRQSTCGHQKRPKLPSSLLICSTGSLPLVATLCVPASSRGQEALITIHSFPKELLSEIFLRVLSPPAHMYARAQGVLPPARSASCCLEFSPAC